MANSVLVIGYGNPGRLDDGLGPALAEALERLNIPGVSVESNYHLALEDAAAVAAHRFVVFADASLAGREPFFFTPVRSAGEPGFSSHTVEPEAVMAMARDLFGGDTKAYALGIRGYRFNAFGEALSEKAAENLAAALRFLAPVLRDCAFDAAVTAAGGGEAAAHVGNVT